MIRVNDRVEYSEEGKLVKIEENWRGKALRVEGDWVDVAWDKGKTSCCPNCSGKGFLPITWREHKDHLRKV